MSHSIGTQTLPGIHVAEFKARKGTLLLTSSAQLTVCRRPESRRPLRTDGRQTSCIATVCGLSCHAKLISPASDRSHSDECSSATLLRYPEGRHAIRRKALSLRDRLGAVYSIATVSATRNLGTSPPQSLLPISECSHLDRSTIRGMCRRPRVVPPAIRCYSYVEPVHEQKPRSGCQPE